MKETSNRLQNPRKNKTIVSSLDFLFTFHILDLELKKSATRYANKAQTAKSQQKPALSSKRPGKGQPTETENFQTVIPLHMQNMTEKMWHQTYQCQLKPGVEPRLPPSPVCRATTLTVRQCQRRTSREEGFSSHQVATSTYAPYKESVEIMNRNRISIPHPVVMFPSRSHLE